MQPHRCFLLRQLQVAFNAGIVNVCVDAIKRFSNGAPLHAVMGGFHLAPYAIDDDRVVQTVASLKALNPSIVLPGHCTGWRAKGLIASAFEGRFQPAVVGGKYVFRSSPKVEAAGDRIGA